jgi:hypothetical protein
MEIRKGDQVWHDGYVWKVASDPDPQGKVEIHRHVFGATSAQFVNINSLTKA